MEELIKAIEEGQKCKQAIERIKRILKDYNKGVILLDEFYNKVQRVIDEL
jgi:ATP:corrinoid adenosyltransferase